MKMKGFIFTLDALFSLIVATAGISILLYVHFVAPLSFQSSITETTNILSEFSTSNINDYFSSIENPLIVYSKNYQNFGGGVFNGYNSSIHASIRSDNIPQSNISISGWVYVKGFDSGNGDQEWWTNNENGGSVGLQSYPNKYPGASSTDLVLFIHNNTNAGFCGISTSAAISKWYFVVETVNSTTGTLYVDGKYIDSCTYTHPGIETSINLGSYSNDGSGNGSIMDGYESNIQIYKSVLSASQVKSLYSEGMEGYPLNNEGLKAWYPLDGNSNDYSGNGNDGTAYNMLYFKSNNVYFGNSSFNSNDPMINFLSSLYLNNQSADADIIMNNIYPNGDIGLFINGTYAPSESVLYLNANNGAYINAPIGRWLGNNTNFTVTAWFESPQGGGPIVGITSSPPGGNWNMPFISMNESGDIFGWTWGMNSLSYKGKFGKWHFAALTYSVNSTGGIEKFYVDGKYVGNDTGDYSPSNSFDYLTTYISGSKPSDTPNYFNGSIADVQIYKSALNPSQINGLYDKGITANPINNTINNWYPFLGNLNDYSGNGNYGSGYGYIFNRSNFIPPSLGSSYIVNKDTQPEIITLNNVTRLYNVSLVLWR